MEIYQFCRMKQTETKEYQRKGGDMWSTRYSFNFLNYIMAKITKKVVKEGLGFGKEEVKGKKVFIPEGFIPPAPPSKEQQLELMLARLEGNHIEKDAVRAIFQSLFRD